MSDNTYYVYLNYRPTVEMSKLPFPDVIGEKEIGLIGDE